MAESGNGPELVTSGWEGDIRMKGSRTRHAFQRHASSNTFPIRTLLPVSTIS